MEEDIPILLRKLKAARKRNEISNEQYKVLQKSILRGRFKRNFKTEDNTGPTYTYRYSSRKRKWSTVIKESKTILMYVVVILCAIELLSKDHTSKMDFSYCDASEKMECENGGVLVKTRGEFVCQCPSNFYGERCADERYWSTISRLLRGAVFGSVNEEMRRGAPKTWWWWSFLPFTNSPGRLQHTAVISFHQDHLQRIMRFSENSNADFSRILPPSRPFYCPVDANLPPLDALHDKVFKRDEDGRLEEDPKRRNLLYRAFHQYFVLQFFNKDFSSTVTGSLLYGNDAATQTELRSMSDGKLKTEYLNGEHYPSRLSFAEKINKVFARTPMVEQLQWFNRAVTDNRVPRNRVWSVFADVFEAFRPRWSVTNPMLSVDPLLFAMSTFWVREHNRLCDELKTRWPEWKDDRLYAVARNTVLGQMMGIMMNDVLPAASPFPLKHDPESYRNLVLNANRDFKMPLEMLLATVLPSGLPGLADQRVDDQSQVLPSSMREMVRLMVDQKMGSLTSNNDGVATIPLTKLLMKLARENKVKSFNDYRRHFGLDAYKSFFELTGNNKTADKLIWLYGDVENVELLTGMLTEKKSDDAVPTFTVMINSFMINSIVTNPLNGKNMWNAATFGGEYGFNLVKSANMKTFICNNLIDKCDDDFIVDMFAK